MRVRRVVNEVAGTEAGFRKGGNCCLGWIWAVEPGGGGGVAQMGQKTSKPQSPSEKLDEIANPFASGWGLGVALARRRGLGQVESRVAVIRFRSDVIRRLTRCPARRIQAAWTATGPAARLSPLALRDRSVQPRRGGS